MRKESPTLSILNMLMTADDWLTTQQIADKVGCDKKTIYGAVVAMELSGFHIDVINGRRGGISMSNKYKFGGIFEYKRE